MTNVPQALRYRGQPISIFGTGGFGREVLCCLLDSARGSGMSIHPATQFVVDDEHYNQTEVMGIPVVRLSQFDPQTHEMMLAVGDPATRKEVASRLPGGTRSPVIVHPSAVISEWVQLSGGTIVTAGTILTCNIKLGAHAHLNLHTTIGHDCVIGDYFTTAPAVNISGNCHFGDCVYLGTNACIKHGITICSHVTVGMGAVVVKDISEEGIYVGTPAKKREAITRVVSPPSSAPPRTE